ncbi:hypothetical protein [Nocardia sp. NPDC049707]|uniref:hypothetical protein n=1 Tax=Nocardia sp. NPDC049707 TaxID=3154735 RepID=UPI0034488738
MSSAGVEFVTKPRREPYGLVAVFLDISGNQWDFSVHRSRPRHDPNSGPVRPRIG